MPVTISCAECGLAMSVPLNRARRAVPPTCSRSCKGKRHGVKNLPKFTAVRTDLAGAAPPPPGAAAIPLTQGFVAWVDEADYESLARHQWRTYRSVSCPRQAMACRGWGRGQVVFMHRELLGASPDDGVDHRVHREDVGVIDNRRSNLRFCSQQQNMQSKRKPTARRRGPLSSIFKGVSRLSTGKWLATIVRPDKKNARLGRFTEEAHAALAYDLAAVKYFGDFALTNFPVPGSTNWLFGDPL